MSEEQHPQQVIFVRTFTGRVGQLVETLPDGRALVRLELMLPPELGQAAPLPFDVIYASEDVTEIRNRAE